MDVYFSYFKNHPGLVWAWQYMQHWEAEAAGLRIGGHLPSVLNEFEVSLSFMRPSLKITKIQHTA